MGRPFERVLTMTDFYDGPRGGIADFDGAPHLYEAAWDSEIHALHAVDEETLRLALEDWAIWLRWESAFHSGETAADTHPALPIDRARHEEVAPLLAASLERVASGASRRARAVFRPAPGHAHGGRGRHMEVAWYPAEPGRALRVALAQCAPVVGDVVANARAAALLVARAAAEGARLVVFPELFLTGYELPLLAATPSAWLTEDDARLEPVLRACADHGVTAVLGAALRTRAGDGVIAAPVIGPSGLVGVSRKAHVHSSEDALFVAGAPLPPFDVDGWRVGVGICFDASRPDHAENAARGGADLYAVSALYVAGEERRVDLHLGARAMDNRIFAALANYAGTTGGHASCGGSGVWGPSGDVTHRAATLDEAFVVVTLEPASLAPYRCPPALNVEYGALWTTTSVSGLVTRSLRVAAGPEPEPGECGISEQRDRERALPAPRRPIR